MSDSGSEAKIQNSPPPARGVRQEWASMPEHVRAAVEAWLGSPVVSVKSQQSGFSPGVAARLRTADNRRVFVKALSSHPNPDSPGIHRKEARITALIPPSAPVPRLLWSYDEGDPGWIVLVFEDIEGVHPAQPWQMDELNRVMDALAELADALTPSPLSIEIVGGAGDAFAKAICGWQHLTEKPELQSRLDAWSARHLAKLAKFEANAPHAVSGSTLLHFDIRGDNLLLTPERVWFFDWPHAAVGAAWVDVISFAPSVRMQGGPEPEDLIARSPACRDADPDLLTAAIISMAGYFTYRALLPPPPGLPSVRAFQAAQGIIAREWVALRTGWT
jgi:aminoglycoside phosphotransferase (APT) family kinase protein